MLQVIKRRMVWIYRIQTSSLSVIKEIILVRLTIQRLKDIKLFCASYVLIISYVHVLYKLCCVNSTINHYPLVN